MLMMFLLLPPPFLPFFQIYHSPITKQEESESLLLLFFGLSQPRGQAEFALQIHSSSNPAE